MENTRADFDLCVVGGGSGGIGAALAAARAGLSVVLIEKSDTLGGNAVRGGVHNWEPGAGGGSFPAEIYERMRRVPGSAGIWSMARHCCHADRNDPPFPGGEMLIDPQRNYADTLLRCGTRGLTHDADRVRHQWHGVIFEPEAYTRAVTELLTETGRCVIRRQAAFVSAQHSEGRLDAIRISHHGTEETIRARQYVDGTADGLLCAALCCPLMSGEEPHSRFQEPDAPSVGDPRKINAVTLIYRVTPTPRHGVEIPPEDVPSACWFSTQWPMAAIGQYPCGDLNINMLPTMEGSAFLAHLEPQAAGYAAAYAECRRRVLGHWRHLQDHYPEFRAFALHWVAPALGVRETRRVIGEYILTEHDLLAGISRQRHPDIIALADHAMDVHGEGNHGCPELSEPYGIPLRCLIPKDWKNVMVACRGASFSHIAASSCRLSRTMMALGQAAGLAAALAIENGGDVRKIDPSSLRQRLAGQGVSLAWPAPLEAR